MNNFRLQRPKKVVYPSRRRSLIIEYADYVTCPLSETLAFDPFPHVTEIACFSCFRDIIRAPEEDQTNENLFKSAFGQLPELVDNWRKKLGAEVAEVIKIPSRLSPRGISNGLGVTSVSTTDPESPKAPSLTDKLCLAYALFVGGIRVLCTDPEVFSTVKDHYTPCSPHDSERTSSIKGDTASEMCQRLHTNADWI